jgi:hypothetical protein
MAPRDASGFARQYPLSLLTNAFAVGRKGTFAYRHANETEVQSDRGRNLRCKRGFNIELVDSFGTLFMHILPECRIVRLSLLAPPLQRIRA